MSEPHAKGQHDAVTKPRVTRGDGHAVLTYSRHTKPGQRLQLVDLGRTRAAVPLEELQPWRAGQAQMRGWQLAAAAAAFAADAQAVRAHLPHACNIEDEMRMAAVPRCESRYMQLSNHNFRDWPGVTANADGSQCCGHFHAYIKREGKQLFSGCPSFKEEATVQLPGLYTMPGTTRTHDSRVDTNLRGAVTVVTQTPNCPSRTMILSTGRLLCPRYAATFKVGLASGHQGCFGRVSPLALMPTVVTRPEPHNLCIVHPTQDRVLTPRENARFQGFPDYYYIASTGSIAKGEAAVTGLEALAPNKPLPVQAAMKAEHATALEGGQKGSRTTANRFRVFNANRYLQTGNAVSPVLSAAVGRAIIAACSGETHAHHPVQSVPDLEWEAAVATARSHGLLTTYQELTLWAEAFQLQQTLGHELHCCASPAPAIGDGFHTPSMDRMRAAATSQQALESAMRRGEAPDDSEALARLRLEAAATVQADDVAYPANATVRIKGKTEGGAIVAAMEAHADTLLTQQLQHAQHAADAGRFTVRRPPRSHRSGDGAPGQRWSDTGIDEDPPLSTPRPPSSADGTATPSRARTSAARQGAEESPAGVLSPDGAAQENVPPAQNAQVGGSAGDDATALVARVKGSCIADSACDALAVERASSSDISKLTHPQLLDKKKSDGSDSSVGGGLSAVERAAEEIRSMAAQQPVAAGCVLRGQPAAAVRSAAACAQKLPSGSVDVPEAWVGRGSAYSLRRRRPVLAQLNAAQAKRARAVLQKTIPTEVLQQLMSEAPEDAAEGRRRLHGCFPGGSKALEQPCADA